MVKAAKRMDLVVNEYKSKYSIFCHQTNSQRIRDLASPTLLTVIKVTVSHKSNARRLVVQRRNVLANRCYFGT